jgi:filamentous hemagglutinin
MRHISNTEVGILDGAAALLLRDTIDQTVAQGSTLSGNTAVIIANNDINLKGSNVVSTQGTVLVAQNNINIEAATETTNEGHLSL